MSAGRRWWAVPALKVHAAVAVAVAVAACLECSRVGSHRVVAEDKSGSVFELLPP